MGYKRVWDSTCPRVWDRFATDGVKWVIQDLPPEDEDEAIEIYRKHMIPDEVLCSCSGVADDPLSEISMLEFWRKCMSQRMTLACYALSNGTKTLVGLNVCVVKCKDDKDEYDEEPKAAANVFKALEYIDGKLDIFKYMELDMFLSALGLVIKREYRGAGIGAKILAAREYLCRANGIKGTSTIFTGPASQKLAARCGFETALIVPLKELAEAGMKYPKDERVIKVMTRKYFDSV